MTQQTLREEEKAVRFLMSKSTDEMYMLIHNLEKYVPVYEVAGKILLNDQYHFLPPHIVKYFSDRYDEEINFKQI